MRSNPMFDGQTYAPQLDRVRLTGQLKEVFSLMRDKKWRTLAEIALTVKASEASVSARLRDARKPRFGEHTVERRRKGNPAMGLFEYRLIENDGKPKQVELF